jgi:hypothetical protein
MLLYQWHELWRAGLAPYTYFADAGAKMYSSQDSWLSSLPGSERAAAAKDMGKILFGAGAALLVGIGAAVAGGALAVPDRRRRRKHDTAEVPVVPPPDAPPSNAPHVTTPTAMETL